jgi:hypothetical protein
VPHCDVLTAEVVGVPLDPDVGVLLVVLLLLLHPAAASIPMTAARPSTARTPEMCSRMLTCPPPPGC